MFIKSFLFKHVNDIADYYFPLSNGWVIGWIFLFASFLLVLYLFEIWNKKSLNLSRTSHLMLCIRGLFYSASPLLMYMDLFSMYTKDIILCVTDDGRDNGVEETSEADYFNSVVKARDKYMKLFEEYNKKYKVSKSNQDKLLMDKYSSKLDAKEQEIETFKEKGYLDPLDLPQSAEGSDAE